MANQFFDPLFLVYYVFHLSLLSCKQVLCALMYEVKSISKNPPSRTTIAVGIQEDRLHQAYRLYRVYRLCRVYRQYRVYQVYRLYRLYRLYQLGKQLPYPLDRNVSSSDLRWCLHDTGATFSRREFTPILSSGSVIVYMIPSQNVMPARVTLAWVHPSCCTGARISLR